MTLRILLAFCVTLSAQTVTGTLEGYVKDATGSTIPAATVVATDRDTGLTRKVETDGNGYFQITFLPVGAYTLRAEAKGFAAAQRMQNVELNSVRAVDFELKLASVSNEVTVVSDSTLIETSKGEVKASLDEKTIEDRPLPSRNILSLVEQLPGFQSPGGYAGRNNPTLSTGSYVSFGGTGSRSASFQVDGVGNDDSSEGTNRQNVNISSIKEFAVVTNAYSAEFGRAGGAVVLVQTKSGTNKIHGDVYEFLQNEKLNSNSFFNNMIGRDAQGKPIAPRAPFRRNQYGYTVGAPIRKNKLFFFHSFEQTKLRQYATIRRFLIPADRIEVGACRLCVNPEQHPNLQADVRFLQSILDRFPKKAPNATAICERCYVEIRPSSFPDEDYSGKIDWNRSRKDTLAVRYQYSRNKRYPGELIAGENAVQNHRQVSLGLVYSRMFNHRTFSELRVARAARVTLVDISAGNQTPVVRIANTSPYSTTLLGNAQQFPINRRQNDQQYNFTVSHLRGKHVWKAGIDYRKMNLDDFADNASRGFWNFTASGLVGQPDRYEGWENFLRGFIRSYQRGYGNFYLENRMGEFNQFVQDDWKVTRTFTLNLGFRYEYVLATREAQKRIDYGFGNFGGLQPRFGFAWSPGRAAGLLAKLTGGPGKMSIRGGAGIFHNRIPQSIFSQSGGASLRSQPPYGAYRTYVDSFDVADPSLDPVTRQPFVYDPSFHPGRIDILRVAPDLGMPSVQQYNFTIERQFVDGITLSVGYNRSRGIGLLANALLNRARFPFTDPLTGILYDKIDPNLGNTAPAVGFISEAQPRVNQRRPDTRYNNVSYVHNGSWSYYNALRLELKRRFKNGTHWAVSYAWSKTVDTGSDFTQGSGIAEFDNAKSQRGLSDFDQRHRLNLNYAYRPPWFSKGFGLKRQLLGGWTISGNNTFATGNPFTVSAGYDMNADGVVNDRPLLLDPRVFGASVDNGRADPVTGKTISQLQLPEAAFFPNRLVSRAQRAFDPGGVGQGSIGRNVFFGQGITFWDLAAAKSFAIREGHALTFRAEMYNVTNTPRFAFPDRALQGVNFGRITSTYNPQNFVGASRSDDTSRVMQMSLRYTF